MVSPLTARNWKEIVSILDDLTRLVAVQRSIDGMRFSAMAVNETELVYERLASLSSHVTAQVERVNGEIIQAAVRISRREEKRYA